ncbi:unnamed protein product [Polarella glacialis]|uniref:Uncharacterized protein n=1 Tax=Polarella glacialis TaxID=89957 RepID=A0A813LJ45_POLGL|nr:unnamed protein product [Polarella glacialis]CAE8733678.1 unnamed protein product [Polarella glacialis]
MAPAETLSDSLRVCLQPWQGDVQKCIRYCECFGPLARSLGICQDGQQSEVVVSFFDVRHASAAKVALGKSCSYAPTKIGQRTLRLQAHAQLDADIFKKVFSIDRDPENGEFVLQFFDSRVAAEVASRAYDSSESDHKRSVPDRPFFASVPEGNFSKKRNAFSSPDLVGQGNLQSPDKEYPEEPLSPGVGSVAHGLRLSQLNWTDLATKKETRKALHLRGMPKALCEVAAMQELLKAQGLLGLVEEVSAKCSSSCTRALGKPFVGSVVLHATSAEAVKKLAKFFHGRQFTGSRPVAVSFADANFKDPLSAAMELWEKAKVGRAKTMSDLPKLPPGLSMSVMAKAAAKEYSHWCKFAGADQDSTLDHGSGASSESSGDTDVETAPRVPSAPPGLEIYAR